MSLQVLVADDDDDVRAMLRALFTRPGMEVLEAATGKQTLDLVARHDPDILVLDWRMPGGGLQLVRELVTERGMENRVIMVSGLADPRDRHSALRSGAARFFVKPVAPNVLVQAVGELGQQLLDQRPSKGHQPPR